ncbi:hypothetical protein HMPREF1989_01885 [Porphyromonas gingivalis F0566]|nr:hypothetical protein HMPREF1989_01885 [Porphyromonas gingivalis F0566]
MDREITITRDFNCTIQELKHGELRSKLISIQHFNCTIQELKRSMLSSFGRTKQ